MKLALLLLLAGSAACLNIPAAATNKYSASYMPGAANPNVLDYRWASGTLVYGEYIGVFESTYTCANGNIDPIIRILPSAGLSANVNGATLTSPQKTTTFSGLAVTSSVNGYKLCYCNFYTPTSGTFICNAAAFGTSSPNVGVDVGQLHVADFMPNQNHAIFAEAAKNGGVHAFTLKFSFGTTASQPTLATQDSIYLIGINGMCGVAGASNTNPFGGEQDPAMSHINLAHTGANGLGAHAAATLNPLTKAVGTSQSYSVDVQTSSAPTPSPVVALGEYKACYCFNSLNPCANPNTGVVNTRVAAYPFHIGTVLFHDVHFHTDSVTLTVGTGQSISLGLKYTGPSTILNQNGLNQFWFTLEGYDCGYGNHTASTSTMTLPYTLLSTSTPALGAGTGITFLTSVDFSKSPAGKKKLRLCVRSVTNNVAKTYDLNNVGVFVTDVVLSTRAVAVISQVNVPQVDRLATTAGVGLTPINISWTESLSYSDKIWFQRSGTACTAPSAIPTSASATASMHVALTYPGIYWMDFSAIPIPVTGTTTHYTYRLCVAPGGTTTSADWVDYGAVISVLQNDVWLNPTETKTVLNRGGNTKGLIFSSTSLFTTSDQLWFRRASQPCGDRTTEGSSIHASTPVQVGTHTTAGTGPNAITGSVAYSLDFSQITVPTNDLFRLCVKQIATSQVYDYYDVVLSVIAATNGPTPYYFRPTAKPVYQYSVTSITTQTFHVSTKSRSINDIWPNVTWSFSGTLTVGDRLGFLPQYIGDVALSCGSDAGADSYWSVLADRSNQRSNSPATSGVLPAAMAPGRYTVCYCNSGWDGISGAPTRNCGEPQNWQMLVGYLNVNEEPPQRQLKAITYSTNSALKIKIPYAMPADRLMLITAGQNCGTAAPVDPSVYQTALTVTDAGTEYAKVSLTKFWSIDGQFDLCYCRSATENSKKVSITGLTGATWVGSNTFAAGDKVTYWQDSPSASTKVLTISAIASNVITTSSAHGLNIGDAVIYKTNNGPAATNLVDGTTYYVESTSFTTTTFRVATSLTSSTFAAQTANPVSPSTTTGVVYYHGFQAYSPAANGFTNGQSYYVIATGLSTSNFQVSTTKGGTAITVTAAAAAAFGNTRQFFTAVSGSTCPTFDTSTIKFAHSYGGPVATVFVHDVNLVSQVFTYGTVDTKRMAHDQATNPAITFKYTKGLVAGTRVWFARKEVDCDINKASAPNATSFVSLNPSGTESGPFSGFQTLATCTGSAGPVVYRMCGSGGNPIGSVTYDLNNVQIVLNDLKVMQFKLPWEGYPSVNPPSGATTGLAVSTTGASPTKSTTAAIDLTGGCSARFPASQSFFSSVSAGTITTQSPHGYIIGDRIRYFGNGGTALATLVDGGVYWVGTTGHGSATFKLVATPDKVSSTTAGDYIVPTGGAAGVHPGGGASGGTATANSFVKVPEDFEDQQVTTNPPVTYMWWASTALSCSATNNPVAVGTSFSKYIDAGQWSTTAVVKTGSLAANIYNDLDGQYVFDISSLSPRQDYRLCVCPNCGKAASGGYTNTDAIIDFHMVKIYPVSSAPSAGGGTTITVTPTIGSTRTIVVFRATASATTAITLSGAATDIVAGDQMWFRRNDYACGSSPAVEGGTTTGTPEVAFSSFAATNFNFAAVANVAGKFFRLCVKRNTYPNVVLDYEAAAVSIETTPAYAGTAVPTYAVTSSPTVPPTYATIPTFTLQTVTMEAASTKPATSVFLSSDFVWKTITTNNNIGAGAKIGFIRHDAIDTAVSSATPCNNLLTPAFYEAYFTQARTGATTYEHTIPNLPGGTYIVCYCKAWEHHKHPYGPEGSMGTCGDGVNAWTTAGFVGTVTSIDADTSQTSAVEAATGTPVFQIQLRQAAGGLQFNTPFKTFTNDNTIDRIYLSSTGVCGAVSVTTLPTYKYRSLVTPSNTLEVKIDSNPPAVGEYAICYCTKKYIGTSIASVCPAVGATLATNKHELYYAKIGTLVSHDIKFDWDTSGHQAFSYSVTKAKHIVMVSYTGSLFVANQDKWWFMDQRKTCASGRAGGTDGTAPMPWPAQTNQMFEVDFSQVATGTHFYRLCIEKPSSTPTPGTLLYKDFGVQAGVFVTDIAVAPKAPTMDRRVLVGNGKALVSIVSSGVLQYGDMIQFVDMSNTATCPHVTRGAAPSWAVTATLSAPFMSNAQMWTASRNYSWDFTGFAPSGNEKWVRLCVSRDVPVDNPPVATPDLQYTFDFKGVRVFPIPNHYELSPNPIEQSTQANLAITHVGNNLASGSVYFRKASEPCNQDTVLNFQRSPQTLPSTSATAKMPAQLATSAGTVSWTNINLSPSVITPTSEFFRMCVENTGVANHPAVIDYDTVGFYLIPDRAPTMLPTAPTAVQIYAPTPALQGTPDPVTQSFTFNAQPVSANTRNQILWKFTGTVHPADSLAVMKSGQHYCTGTNVPHSYVAATNSSVSVSTNTYSGDLGFLPVGKYLLCFCNNATSNLGCSHESSYRSQVGYVTFWDAPYNQTASVAKADDAAGFSVSLNFASTYAAPYAILKQGDRLMLIPAGGVCGVTAPSTANNDLIVSAKSVNGYVMTYGAYKKNTAGIFSVCYCYQTTQQTTSCDGATADPNYLPSYGGPIATLVIHDVQLNNAYFAQVNQTSKIADLKITQTIFNFGSDKIWFAKGGTSPTPCGAGNHVDTATLTIATVMQQTMQFNFNLGGKAASSDLWRLCVKSSSANKVYDISTVGLYYTDIKFAPVFSPNLIDVSPERKSNAVIQLYHAATLSASATTYFYWRATDKACFTTYPSSVVNAAGKDVDTSVSVAVSNSGSNYQFDLTSLMPRKKYRLCVGKGYVAATPSTFTSAMDISDIVIQPRQVGMVISSGNLLNATTNKVSFVQSDLQAQDEWWLTIGDKSCPTTPPSTSDAFNVAAQKFAYTSNVDATNALVSNIPFRMCVRMHTTLEILDYSSIQTSVVSISPSVDICGKSSCPIKMVFAGMPQGTNYFWYQSPNSPCVNPNSGTSNSYRSGYSSVAVSGYTTYMDFTNVNAGPTNVLQLCTVSSSVSAVVSSYPSIMMMVSDIALTLASGLSKQTEIVEASLTTRVNMTYGVNTMPYGSKTWWQTKGSTCKEQPATATVSGAVSTIITSAPTPSGGTSIAYDFSVVTTAANGATTEFTMCMSFQTKVYSFSNMLIKVFRFHMTPTQIAGSSTEQITFMPRTIYQGIYFRQADLSCYPRITGLAGNNHTQYQFASADTHAYDFSKMTKRSQTKFRVCGVRIGYSNNVQSYVVDDLMHLGVYITSGLSVNPPSVGFAAKQIVHILYTGNTAIAAGNDTIFFTRVGVACPTAAAPAASDSTSDSVPATAAPMTGVFDFSKASKTATGVFRMCVRTKAGSTVDYDFLTVAVVDAEIDVATVFAGVDNKMKVSYNAGYLSPNAYQVWFSSDTSCSSLANRAASSAATSLGISGSVHTFDFSGAQVSDNAWHMCVQAISGQAPFKLTTPSVVVTDVGQIYGNAGNVNSVDPAKDQNIKIVSSATIKYNDKVWFTPATTCTGTPNTPEATFLSSPDVKFDFSGQTVSTMPWKLCTRNSAGKTTMYASRFVYLTSISVTTPVVVGARTLALSWVGSPFATGDSVAFALTSVACSAASLSWVSTGATSPITLTNYQLSIVGSYRLCVKRTSGDYVDLKETIVSAASCSSVCSVSNSDGVCDVVTGHCKNCKAGYSGNTCATCTAGYVSDNNLCKTCSTFCSSSGTNKIGQLLSCSRVGTNPVTCDCNAGFTGSQCNVCDAKNNYHCNGYVNGVAPSNTQCLSTNTNGMPNTCIACSCNYRQKGAALCPTDSGACDCKEGYRGHFCEKCDAGFECTGKLNSDGSCSNFYQCIKCGCNGHYNPAASPRCPGGSCVCLSGYTGSQCESCVAGDTATKTPGYRKVASGSGFTCTSCASSCNNRAYKCDNNGALACECTDNYDPATFCSTCKPGTTLFGTSCVGTSSPTTLSPTTPKPTTAKPTGKPTTPIPSKSPTAPTTARPTNKPTTAKPTNTPTGNPTKFPTRTPTKSPTHPGYFRVCDNYFVFLACTSGKIAIREASYGRRTGTSAASQCAVGGGNYTACTVSVLDQLTTMCLDKNGQPSSTCTLQKPVTPTTFEGKTCGGTNNMFAQASYLEGYYECAGGQVNPPTTNPTGEPTTQRPTPVPVPTNKPTTGKPTIAAPTPLCNNKVDSLDQTRAASGQTALCPQYAAYCKSDSTWNKWAMDNCAKTCCLQTATYSPTAKPSKPPTAGASSCSDASSNCAAWKDLGYCTKSYVDYMKENCQKSCQVCSTSTAAVDANTNCGSWASSGYCTGSYEAYMKTNCPIACAALSKPTAAPAPTASASQCVGNPAGDASGNCASWASSGYCVDARYKTYMLSSCATSCCDRSSSCPAWANSGYCASSSTYFSYMTTNCKASCGAKL